MPEVACTKDVAARKVQILNISFAGNKRSKEQMLLRELNIKIGDSIAIKNVHEVGKQNSYYLFNLQLYRSVNYTCTFIDSNTVQYTFILKEKIPYAYTGVLELADRNFNVWWNDQGAKLNRLNYGFVFSRLNFRGRNETINSTWVWGYKRYAELEYIKPYIDKKMKHGLGAKLNYASGKELFYDIDANKQLFFRNEENLPYYRLSAELNYTYKPALMFTNKLSLSATYWHISDSLYQLNNNFLGNQKQAILIPEVKYSISSNQVNDINYPLSGNQLRVTIGHKGLKGIENTIRQNYLLLYLAKYVRFNNLYLSFINRSRISSTRDQPFVNNRALGFGSDYVRGFEYFVIDGNHYALQRCNIKYKIYQKNHSKYYLVHTQLPMSIFPKLFLDAGYVNGVNNKNGYLNNTLLLGYGAGLDVYIRNRTKIRLEYAFNNFKRRDAYLHLTSE